MSPGEFHLLCAAKQEQADAVNRKYAGMTEAEARQIYEETYGEE